MTRFSSCFSVLLLSCTAISASAQAAAPVAPPAPANVTASESPAVKEFQKIEDSWADSVNQHDQYGLELVLSPLFVDVSASGDVTTRNQQVAAAITSEDKSIHLDQRVITVRMLGDVAVANGTYTLHRKISSGPVDEKGVFTHVFERTHGGWLCINSQRTVLREEASVKTRKQSNAELPFHIPLFTKSSPNNQ
ncbi:MAG: nuclear transport factor 2 family protein [Terracidiphilus sp.]